MDIPVLIRGHRVQILICTCALNFLSYSLEFGYISILSQGMFKMVV